MGSFAANSGWFKSFTAERSWSNTNAHFDSDFSMHQNVPGYMKYPPFIANKLKYFFLIKATNQFNQVRWIFDIS